MEARESLSPEQLVVNHERRQQQIRWSRARRMKIRLRRRGLRTSISSWSPTLAVTLKRPLVSVAETESLVADIHLGAFA